MLLHCFPFIFELCFLSSYYMLEWCKITWERFLASNMWGIQPDWHVMLNSLLSSNCLTHSTNSNILAYVALMFTLLSLETWICSTEKSINSKLSWATKFKYSHYKEHVQIHLYRPEVCNKKDDSLSLYNQIKPVKTRLFLLLTLQFLY